MTGPVIRFWRRNRRLLCFEQRSYLPAHVYRVAPICSEHGSLPPAMRTGEHTNQSCRACRKAGTGGVRSERASSRMQSLSGSHSTDRRTILLWSPLHFQDSFPNDLCCDDYKKDDCQSAIRDSRKESEVGARQKEHRIEPFLCA